MRSSQSVASARPVTGSWSHWPVALGSLRALAVLVHVPPGLGLDSCARVRPAQALFAHDARIGPAGTTAEAPGGFGYTTSVMTTNASEALVHLDELRERLKEASGRLGWLRSYL